MKKTSLHYSVLPLATRKAFSFASTNLLFLARSPWYLAGGTALALQVGHRQSVDLDFFIPTASFQERAVERHLTATKKWQTTFREEGTLYGTLMHAKMSFIVYPFFRPSRQREKVGYIRMLTPKDIAAMKIIAISQRGRKRDFIDLYWYCTQHEPLIEVMLRSMDQYPHIEHNMKHLLRSLTYFDDAEADPMPRLFFKANWNSVKTFFRREVPRVARILLELD